jgi:non-ribosomal peptide synthetase component F
VSATLLQDYAARGAERDPSKIALVMADEQVTYGQLERESNQLARLLIEHGCRPDDRVCLFTPKSPAAIVAMHAILKAGAAYVPIDPASPAARIAKILEAAEPRRCSMSWSAPAVCAQELAGLEPRRRTAEASPPRSPRAIGVACRRSHLGTGAAPSHRPTSCSRRGRPAARKGS